jgi:hypothetical protein
MYTPKIWLRKQIKRVGGLQRYLEATHRTFTPTTHLRYIERRLDLLQDVVPGLAHVVVLWNAAHPANVSVRSTSPSAVGLRPPLPEVITCR